MTSYYILILFKLLKYLKKIVFVRISGEICQCHTVFCKFSSMNVTRKNWCSIMAWIHSEKHCDLCHTMLKIFLPFYIHLPFFRLWFIYSDQIMAYMCAILIPSTSHLISTLFPKQELIDTCMTSNIVLFHCYLSPASEMKQRKPISGTAESSFW